MTKKDAIEAVELTQWCGSASEEEIFNKLHAIAIEYESSTKDHCLYDLFSNYLYEYDAMPYIENELGYGGVGRVCAVVRNIHKLNATVFVRDMNGDLRDYTHKDTEYIRSEMLHRLSDSAIEEEYIEKVKSIDRTKPCNEIYRELQNLARMYNDETGYRGFKYLFEHDTALQLLVTADPEKTDTDVNMNAVLNELEHQKNDKRRID